MLSVLYEDSDILVAVKPAGVESQSARGFAKDMVSEIRRYLTIQARNPQNIHKLTTLSSKGQGKNQPPYVGVIHRLDRPVSGIMVYARNQKAAASLSSLMQQGKMEKWYKAVVCGKPVDEQGTYVDYLLQNRKSNCSEIVDKSVENLWIIMVYMWIISDRIRERTGLKLWINRQQEVNGQSFHIRQRHRQSAVTRGRAGNTVW